MNINEINDSQVTINNYNVASGAVQGAEDAITNETSFAELLTVLRSLPEAISAAAYEMATKRYEEQKARTRRIFGDGLDACAGDADEQQADRKNRRPGAKQLRGASKSLARIDLGNGGYCEVFVNGYAVYDNGNRKTVLWVPDCGHVTYYFLPLRENEKMYMNEKQEISDEEFGAFPWFNAVMVAGENQIEVNMDHPKSEATMSDTELLEAVIEVKAERWIGGARFDDPETAYLRKEAKEELRKMLTERQREIYILYFERGYSTREIEAYLGIDHSTVEEHLRYILRKNKKIFI